MPQKPSRFRNSLIAALAVAAGLGCTQAQAANLKSSEFLKYSDGQKHWYYAGFFDALGSWSALNEAKNAQCVWGWLADKPKERKALLDRNFKAFPNHAAQSVIIALVQRDCGPILTPQAKN